MNKQEFLKKIQDASKSYYANEEYLMTDEEYDDLMSFGELNGWIKQDNKVNDVELNLFKSSNTIKHNSPMLSLKKAKTLEEVKKFYDDCVAYGAKTFVVEPKLDGLALSNIYNTSNNLTTLASRGNGSEGEDLSYLISSKEVCIEGLLLKNIYDDIKEIRGEIFCSKKDLVFNNKSRGENFKNERSAVSGIVKKAEKGLGYKAKLHFIAYFGIDKNNNLVTLPKEYNNQARFAFNNNIAHTYEELVSIIKKADNWRNQLDFPTDGIVIKPLEHIRIGTTDHHPKEFIAFKYPSIKKSTKIKEIVYEVGKTGKINPVVIVDTVNLDGADVSNASLHNYDWAIKKGVKIGATVMLTRSNDVIPYISSVIDNSNCPELEIPKYCPICKKELSGDLTTLVCKNKNCKGVLSSKLQYVVGKTVFDIDGLSKEVLKALEIYKLEELFNLDLENLKNLKYKSGVSLGDKRAVNIYNNIQKTKLNTSEDKWFCSLNINNVGPVNSKTILNHIGLEELLSLDDQSLSNRLSKIKGIGPELIKSINEEKQGALKTILDLKKMGAIIEHKKPKVIDTSNFKLIVHTGKVPSKFKNRGELEEYLLTKNYKLVKSVTNKVSYLLSETISSSSKFKKAEQLNIPILNWDDLVNTFTK